MPSHCSCFAFTDRVRHPVCHISTPARQAIKAADWKRSLQLHTQAIIYRQTRAHTHTDVSPPPSLPACDVTERKRVILGQRGYCL